MTSSRQDPDHEACKVTGTFGWLLRLEHVELPENDDGGRAHIEL